MNQSLHAHRLLWLTVVLLMALLAACGQPAPDPQPADGQSTPAAAAGEGEEITLFVGPEQVDCVGVGPQQCLQVREQPDAEYQLFYDPIEGFTFEPGFEYELRVLREPVPNPPADASAFRYTLIEEVNRMPVSSAGIEDSIWQASSYVDSAATMTQVLPEAVPIVEFTEGRVFGESGCNNFQGTYQLDGSTLSIELGGVTMRACPEPIMAQEAAFLAALENTAAYSLSGDSLELQDSGGAPLIMFTRLAPTELSGTTWLLSAYNNGQQAVVSPIVGTEITAVFDENGQLAGSASCNAYRGPYQIDGERMTIGPLATTRRACADPQGVLDQELAYLAALQQTASFEIRGDQLSLRDAEGALMASYIARGPAATPGDDAAPEPPASEAPTTAPAPAGDLSGTIWQWQSFQSMDGSETPVNDPSRYTLEFMPDGQLAIRADCNQASGQYSREGSSLTITLGPTTLVACPEDSQADDFLRYLGEVASFVIEDTTLFLNLRVDSGNMVLQPAGQ